MQPEKITTRSREEKIRFGMEGERPRAILRIQNNSLFKVTGGKGEFLDVMNNKTNIHEIYERLALFTRRASLEFIADELPNDFTLSDVERLADLHKAEIIDKICERLVYDSKSNLISIDGEIF